MIDVLIAGRLLRDPQRRSQLIPIYPQTTENHIMNAVTRVSIRNKIKTRLDETRRAYVEATDRAEQLRREEMELGRRLDAIERTIQNLENAGESPDSDTRAEYERLHAAFRTATEGGAAAESETARLNAEIRAIEGEQRDVPERPLPTFCGLNRLATTPRPSGIDWPP